MEEQKRTIIPGQGTKLGGGVSKGEWRCKICKFKNASIENSDEIERCTMCKEPKTVLKEAPPVKVGIPKVPPTKMHIEETK
jgi:hypothetical protein